MKFRPGDRVEYDSYFTHAERDGCITKPTGKRVIFQGVYAGRVDDLYSDVSIGGCKPLLVRTSRLRRQQRRRCSGDGEAA